jgi:hypothetical protein
MKEGKEVIYTKSPGNLKKKKKKGVYKVASWTEVIKPEWTI